MTDTEHPDAEDYRNRAERAEQALAEMAGWDGLSLAVALTQCQAKLAAAEADADRLAEALGCIDLWIDEVHDRPITTAENINDAFCIYATPALAAHNARRIDG